MHVRINEAVLAERGMSCPTPSALSSPLSGQRKNSGDIPHQREKKIKRMCYFLPAAPFRRRSLDSFDCITFFQFRPPPPPVKFGTFFSPNTRAADGKRGTQPVDSSVSSQQRFSPRAPYLSAGTDPLLRQPWLMEHLNELSMELLRTTNKVETMASSTTNMSKSISGASLSSSQATHRTQCSSGLSSVSARFGNLSSSPTSPTGDDTTADGAVREDAPASGGGAHHAPRSTAPVAGGGKTVLAGVAPSYYGKLRRRARFHGWKEPAYFELRSTALLTFADRGAKSGAMVGCGGNNGGGITSGSSNGGQGHGGSLASLAAKIMHPRHAAQVGVEWSWNMDLCGAERIVELPASTRKDLFAFQVEFPAKDKKKPLALAAPSAAERERWMAAMDRAKRCVQPEVSLFVKPLW